MAKVETIKKAVTTGNAAKAVGGATIGLAIYGIVDLGRKAVKGVSNTVDRVFPKAEREDLNYVPEEDIPSEETK